MKTLFKGFLIASLMFIGVAANAQTKIYSNVGTIDVTKAEYNGDQVDVAYTVTIDPDIQNIIGLKGKKGVVLTTALAEGDYKQLIECLVISPANGNARTPWLEARCDDVTNNVRYFNAKADEPLVIKSNYTLKAKDWTSPKTVLTLTAQEYKSEECLVRLMGPKNIAKLDVKDLVPAWAELAAPEDGPNKHLSTKLYYPVNVTKEVDDYLENAQALSLLKTLDSPNFEVTNITINGWASPEASVAYNQNLSVKRAATMKDIISSRYSFPESVYTVAGKGEYWDGVDEYVAASNDAALKSWAQKSFSNLDAKEAALKQLSAYKDIFNNVYPRARFADCDVSYKLVNYDEAAVRSIYNQFPEQVRESEYVALATANDKVDMAIVEKGLKYYPNSAALNNLAAKAAFANGQYRQAISYLQKAGDSKEIQNNIGACYMLLGDRQAAAQAFQKAYGLPEATENIQMLRMLQ
jgi:outer membrane protein OmpA-like peptidoglycan-associated protein